LPLTIAKHRVIGGGLAVLGAAALAAGLWVSLDSRPGPNEVLAFSGTILGSTFVAVGLWIALVRPRLAAQARRRADRWIATFVAALGTFMILSPLSCGFGSHGPGSTCTNLVGIRIEFGGPPSEGRMWSKVISLALPFVVGLLVWLAWAIPGRWRARPKER
jgi:hypothetical protein